MNRKLNLNPHRVALALYLLAAATMTNVARTAPQAAAPDKAALQENALQAVASLLKSVPPAGLSTAIAVPDATITLEARRLPLPEVLAAVEKQGGVTLQIAPGTFARAPKLTMAVAQMPLREWMDTLAKLYDVRWQANGAQTFALQTCGRDELAHDIRLVGELYNYEWDWFYRDGMPDYLKGRPVFPWKQVVDDNLDLAALNAKGVDLSTTPAELQQAVRHDIERQVAVQVLEWYRQLDGATDPLTIAFAKPPGGTSITDVDGPRAGTTVFTPHPVTADIRNHFNMTIMNFRMAPSQRGRDFFDDPMNALPDVNP